MRQPKDRAWWAEEARYIEEQAARPFNERMSMFESYCNMQLRFAEQDGCKEEAGRIYQALREMAE